MHPNDAKDGMLKRPCGNSNWSTTRDSKEGVRTEMGTRDRKARLAVLEKAHAPTAGLSYMQAQITNSKTSMSAIACFKQLRRNQRHFGGIKLPAASGCCSKYSSVRGTKSQN